MALIGGVGIATGYVLDGPGSVPGGARILSTPHPQDRLWGLTHPPVQWVPEVLSLGGG
jgi:hypothetical protein